MLLQKRIPSGNDSISFKIDDPVVVKPDMVSKKALVKSGIELLIRNGKLPKKEKSTQTEVTIINPSRFPISFLTFLVKAKMINPVAEVIRVERNSAFTSGPLYIIATKEAISMAIPSTTKRNPRIRIINLKFNI